MWKEKRRQQGFPCLLFAWNLTCKSWVNCSCVRFARGFFSALIKSTGGSARFSGVTCKLSLPNTALHRRRKNEQHNVKYLFWNVKMKFLLLPSEKYFEACVNPWMLSDKMLVFRRDSFTHAFVGLRWKLLWPGHHKQSCSVHGKLHLEILTPQISDSASAGNKLNVLKSSARSVIQIGVQILF